MSELPAGVRRVFAADDEPTMSLADARALGDEAVDLTTLAHEGVPVCPGYVVRLSGDHPERRLVETVTRGLAEAPCVRLRPLFPTHAAARRFSARVGALPDVTDATAAGDVASRLLTGLRTPELTAALGGSLLGLHVRVMCVVPDYAGVAETADRAGGDPDALRVVPRGAPGGAWAVDRRTMRITERGDGLDERDVERVADLADRAQLALGRPLRVEWGKSGDRFVLLGVATLALGVRPSSPWRRVALVAADEGTVAPLSVDALDRALSASEPGPHMEHAVRRIFARPYRRLEPGGSLGAPQTTLPRAIASAGLATRDVGVFVRSVREARRALSERLREIDVRKLADLSDESLLDSARRRQKLVAEHLVSLDAGRVLTLRVLEALEHTIGPLPRECYPALAAPKGTSRRRRVVADVVALGERVWAERGRLSNLDPEQVDLSEFSPSVRKEWGRVREAYADIRPLGIDVVRGPIGGSDAAVAEAIREYAGVNAKATEQVRRDAIRRLTATARTRRLGRGREGLVIALGRLLVEVAASKGVIAEGLAASLLRLRAAALEIGARLVDQVIIDEPEHALYLRMAELEEALSGEPGAYASRVRVRREDDARWAHFAAPRRA